MYGTCRRGWLHHQINGKWKKQMGTLASKMRIFFVLVQSHLPQREKHWLILSKCVSGVDGYQEELLLPLWKALKHQLLRESGKWGTCACVPVFCMFIHSSFFCHFCTASVRLSVRLSAYVDIPRSSVVPMVTSSGSLMRSTLLHSFKCRSPHQSPPSPGVHCSTASVFRIHGGPSQQVPVYDHREWRAGAYERSLCGGWWSLPALYTDPVQATRTDENLWHVRSIKTANLIK